MKFNYVEQRDSRSESNEQRLAPLINGAYYVWWCFKTLLFGTQREKRILKSVIYNLYTIKLDKKLSVSN